MLQKGMVSSQTNEWETPQVLFNILNLEFNFTLDVAANKNNFKVEKYFTKENNGLLQNWGNNVCWMNPPYGGQTGEWIKKAWRESLTGAIVVCLITSSTDRSYWHDYIFPYAAQIRWVRGRLCFGNIKTSAPFASAIVIFDEKNKYPKKFVYSQKSHCEEKSFF